MDTLSKAEFRMNRWRSLFALRISLVYAVLAAVWIFFSDQLLALQVTSPYPLTLLQTYKGFLFIAFTTAGLFLVLRREFQKQQQIESQRRAAEVSQSDLVEVTLEAIISIDADHRITLFNHSAEEVFGFSRAEVLGRSIDILIPPDLTAIHRQHVDNFSRGPEVARHHGTHRMTHGRRKDGSIFPIDASIVKLKHGGGTTLTVILRDITERQQAQEERLKHELLRLEVAKERELLALRERFLSTVSHEFRIPLSVILTSSDILKNYNDRLSPEQRARHLLNLQEQVRYMTRLMDEVLLINRAEAGKLEFNPQPMDLVGFCRGLVEQIHALASESHRVEFVSAGDFGGAHMDEKLLQHILMNLLSNAVKYSPNGGEVRFELLREESEVIFRIGDQGIGIPTDDMPRIYDTFHRAGNTGTIYGSGLGLAIVKNSVEAHGGSITCDSREGQGTTFTVRLPLINQSASESASSSL